MGRSVRVDRVPAPPRRAARGWARRAIAIAVGAPLLVLAVALALVGSSSYTRPPGRSTVDAAGVGIPPSAVVAALGQRYPAQPGGPAGGPGDASTGEPGIPAGRSRSAAAPAASPAAAPAALPLPNPLDPEQWSKWARDLFGSLLVEFFKGILATIRGIVGALFGALGTDQGNLLVPIPPAMTYDHPVVRQYQGLLIGAANAGLACVLALGGINVMLKDRIGATYHDAIELLPRFMIGAAFINLAREPGRFLIDFAGAAIAGVGATGAPGWGALPADAKTIGDVLLALFYLVALLCLVLQIYLRLVLVDLLLILTPLAMLAWILPQTREIARRWTNALVSTVATFFVQSLALKVGGALLQAGLTDTSGAGALASLFLSGAFFVLLFRLPGMVGQHSGGGGTIARVVMTRLVVGAMSGGRVGAGGRP